MGVTALWSLSKTIYPSLVLVQPRKTRPCLTERLLTRRKESNQPKFEVATSKGLGGDMFTRNVTDGRTNDGATLTRN